MRQVYKLLLIAIAVPSHAYGSADAASQIPCDQITESSVVHTRRSLEENGVAFGIPKLDWSEDTVDSFRRRIDECVKSGQTIPTSHPDLVHTFDFMWENYSDVISREMNQAENTNRVENAISELNTNDDPKTLLSRISEIENMVRERGLPKNKSDVLLERINAVRDEANRRLSEVEDERAEAERREFRERSIASSLGELKEAVTKQLENPSCGVRDKLSLKFQGAYETQQEKLSTAAMAGETEEACRLSEEMESSIEEVRKAAYECEPASAVVWNTMLQMSEF
jgi:predicted secreted Zn-dependent protease